MNKLDLYLYNTLEDVTVRPRVNMEKGMNGLIVISGS